MITDMVKNGLIQVELEKSYRQALRLRKKIDNNLKRLPSNKSVRVRSKAIENLERLGNCSIGFDTKRKTHEGGYGNSIGTQALINILQKGRVDMEPRPFIELFKKRLRLDFPPAKDMNTLDFSTIKKNIEDEIDNKFALAMAYNTLGLAKLKYRSGIPIMRTGRLVKSIRWKVIENAN